MLWAATKLAPTARSANEAFMLTGAVDGRVVDASV